MHSDHERIRTGPPRTPDTGPPAGRPSDNGPGQTPTPNAQDTESCSCRHHPEGSRPSFSQAGALRVCLLRSGPVTMKPWLSSSIDSASHRVCASAPIRTNRLKPRLPRRWAKMAPRPEEAPVTQAVWAGTAAEVISLLHAPALAEFDADRVVAALVDVLDRMRALRLQPAHPYTRRGPGVSRGLKHQCATRVIPDPGRLVDDHHARGLVGVLGLARSWLDHHLQHPHLVVLQQNAMGGWRGEQCIHRLRPWPWPPGRHARGSLPARAAMTSARRWVWVPSRPTTSAKLTSSRPRTLSRNA